MMVRNCGDFDHFIMMKMVMWMATTSQPQGCTVMMMMMVMIMMMVVVMLVKRLMMMVIKMEHTPRLPTVF